VHATSGKKRDDSKDSFYKELEFQSVSELPYEILLGVFNTKLRVEYIFKLIIGNESLHRHSNDNGVKRVNFTTSKNLVV
jgi:hypothetical protein